MPIVCAVFTSVSDKLTASVTGIEDLPSMTIVTAGLAVSQPTVHVLDVMPT